MPEIALSRSRALVLLLCAVLVLVLAGRFVSRDGASAGTSAGDAGALRARSPAETTIVVHVVGAVRRPGLYKLADGSRTADAVARAGGATARADLALVNLAAPIVDGAQIVVPARMAQAPGGAAAPTTAGPLHLNTATPEQLDELPGVGPATAQKIVEYRQEHGAFTSVDDLDAVPGIGPARLAELRELVVP